MHRPIRSRLAALAVGLAILVGAAAVPGGPAAAALEGVTVQGSIGRLGGWGFDPGDAVELLGPGGGVLASEPADAQGAVLFKGLDPADGYALRTADGTSDPVAVLDADVHPDPSSYDDVEIDEGYGYIPTRDGTLLSANVAFPSVTSDADGPWPVLVVYSGYDPSDPGGLPAEAQPYLFRGYVVVGVNMRGSGCSGGDFDYNAAPAGTDGYDVIEALARQPWSNGRVGMIGISYSAISQLYVAASQPPHLEAITPVSAYANAYHGILYPGGIRNEGFALEWALDRQAAAQPLARGWARRRVEGATPPAPPTRCSGSRAGTWRRRSLRSASPTSRTSTSTSPASRTASRCRPTWAPSSRTSRPAAARPGWPRSCRGARRGSAACSATAPTSSRWARPSCPAWPSSSTSTWVARSPTSAW